MTLAQKVSLLCIRETSEGVCESELEIFETREKHQKKLEFEIWINMRNLTLFENVISIEINIMPWIKLNSRLWSPTSSNNKWAIILLTFSKQLPIE